MSELGQKLISHALAIDVRYGGKADVPGRTLKSPLIAITRHADAHCKAWILPTLHVSVLGEGDRAWNAGLLPFLPPTWWATAGS